MESEEQSMKGYQCSYMKGHSGRVTNDNVYLILIQQGGTKD